MSVTNLGIDPQLLDDVFSASRHFFASDLQKKLECAYLSAIENFGYQGLCTEHLDPTRPADLKETFTMRNVLNDALDDGRWPSAEFRRLMQRFYRTCLDGAYKIQRVLAQALDLEQEFFVRYLTMARIARCACFITLLPVLTKCRTCNWAPANIPTTDC